MPVEQANRSVTGEHICGVADGDHHAPASEPGVVVERIGWVFAGARAVLCGDETDQQFNSQR